MNLTFQDVDVFAVASLRGYHSHHRNQTITGAGDHRIQAVDIHIDPRLEEDTGIVVVHPIPAQGVDKVLAQSRSLQQGRAWFL